MTSCSCMTISSTNPTRGAACLRCTTCLSGTFRAGKVRRRRPGYCDRRRDVRHGPGRIPGGKRNPENKEAALRKLISAALYTGSGEFIELLLGIKPIEQVTQKDIYKIYDYKTTNYTFASPLTMGSTLAGAKESQTQKLFSYGMLLGRAVSDQGRHHRHVREGKRHRQIKYHRHQGSKKDTAHLVCL